MAYSVATLNFMPAGADIASVIMEAARRGLSRGSSVTSLPLLVRGGMAAGLCTAPVFFAAKLATNWGTPAAMVCLLGLVLSAAPAAVILPALRSRVDVATRSNIEGRRLERRLRTQLDLERAHKQRG